MSAEAILARPLSMSYKAGKSVRGRMEVIISNYLHHGVVSGLNSFRGISHSALVNLTSPSKICNDHAARKQSLDLARGFGWR